MARLTTKIARLFRQNRAPLTILSTILLMVYVHFELQMLNILPKHKAEHVREAKKEKTVREGLKDRVYNFVFSQTIKLSFYYFICIFLKELI